MLGQRLGGVVDINEPLWVAESHQGPSASSTKVYEHIETWRNRPIDGAYPCIYLEGIELEHSWAGRSSSRKVKHNRWLSWSGHRPREKAYTAGCTCVCYEKVILIGYRCLKDMSATTIQISVSQGTVERYSSFIRAASSDRLFMGPTP